MSTLRPRQRVRYVGPHGTADGPTGRVWRVTPLGEVWVTVDGGRRERWHPDDVAPIAEPAGLRSRTGA